MDNNRIVTMDSNFNSNDTNSELKGPAVYIAKKQNVKKSFSEKRTENRKLQTIDNEIKVSLQECDIAEDLRLKLYGLLNSTKSKFRFRSLLGLTSILDFLDINGYILFDDAYDIYCSFFETCPDKAVFRDTILGHDIGLPICYFTHPTKYKKYICIRSSNIQTEKTLKMLLLDFKLSQEEKADLDLPSETVKSIIGSMETEFDKTCLSVILGATYSNQKLYSCGINPVLARKQLNKVTEAAYETKNAELAATDIVKLKLANDIETLEKKLEHLNKLLTADNRQPATRIADLDEEILEMDKRLKDKKEILSSEQPKYRQRYQQTVKRTAKSLMDENRIKKRKLGAGAPEKIDSEDEVFLLNCIEEKATAHGRRHDAVLYLNKTVRKRDFKRIINFKRHQQGKTPIRSDTTAYNRARPSNVRHIQAKLHKGRGLFCCKKPTKSEEKNKIHTKHQRAHIKRAVMHLCQHNPDNVLIHSIDDKAYIKPEASDGLDKFRVFLSTDANTMKRLPKYDFANAKLNITPGSHRYMEKNITNVNGEASIMLSKDQSVCVMRPKFYVGSSGSVWASEDRRLRVEKPDLYEVKSCNFSSEFRIICHRVRDKIRHFIDQTEENDIKNVSNNKVCSHRNYEQERINSVKIWLKKAKKDMDIHTFSISAYEADKLQELRNKVNLLNEELTTLNNVLEQRLKGAELVLFYKDLVTKCKDLVNYMQTLKLPDTKPVVLELTDAGPGVGKSNRDVRMRATEKVRLDNLDLYARIHRATGDCQNEVERTQAAVGRAIVDGGSIKWKHKCIEDYDNAKQLSFDEYEKLEEEITIHNVLETCKDLSSRVDGSPGPRGDFMEGLVSEDKSDLFYTDAKYLKDFLDASETKKRSLPGYNYYFKLQSFYEKHFEEGELYIEFRKNSCIEGIDNGTLCSFCQNGWRSTITSRIPRPFPGQNYQYLSVKDTPVYDDDGSFRKPDDFQPRAQIRKLHKSGLLCSQDKEKVDEFCQKYAVGTHSLAEEELSHLEYIQLKREKRAEKTRKVRDKNKEKRLEDYDMNSLYLDGKVKTIPKDILAAYVDRNKISPTIPKTKKALVAIVESFMANKNMKQILYNERRPVQIPQIEPTSSSEDKDDTEDTQESDSPGDTDIESFGDASSSENESEHSSIDIVETKTSRSGRQYTNWRERHFFGC